MNMQAYIPQQETTVNHIALCVLLGLDKMTEKAAPDEGHSELTLQELATSTGNINIQPPSEIQDPDSPDHDKPSAQASRSAMVRTPQSLSFQGFSCKIYLGEMEHQFIFFCGPGSKKFELFLSGVIFSNIFSVGGWI